MTDDGWTESAEAWIAAIGEDGDWTRTHVLDRPMLARVEAGNFVRRLMSAAGRDASAGRCVSTEFRRPVSIRPNR